MSKTASTAFKGHLAGEVATLATLWQLVRTDGTVMGFTDASQDVPFTDSVAGFSNAVVYKASTGVVPSGVKGTSDMAVDNLEVVSMLDSAGITDADLEAGLYDYAKVLIMQVNYADLTMGAMVLKAGWLGEVSRHRFHFQAEVRGKLQALQQPVGRVYLPTCNADLGDARCKVVLAPLTVTGTLTGVTNNRTFADSSRTEVDNYFRFGKLTWTGGNNSGRSMEVKSFAHTGGAFTITQLMPRAVQIGDTYSVYPGCNKMLVDARGCSGFSNTVNFRGYPYVPGPDKMVKYPNAH